MSHYRSTGTRVGASHNYLSNFRTFSDRPPLHPSPRPSSAYSAHLRYETPARFPNPPFGSRSANQFELNPNHSGARAACI
jgi:hypothetical protein